MKLRITLSLLLAAAMLGANAQIEWELSKDKNNIKVYTAKEGSSKYKSVKVEAVMNGSVQKLATIIRDINNNKNWVYSTKQSYVIKKNGLNDVLYYLETELPWPVENRDVAIRMHLHLDSIKNILKVNTSAEPLAIPEKKDIVRIKQFNSTWNVRAINKNQISISYMVNMHPGGNVPASVLNMFVSKGPYETFNNLAQLLKK